MVRSITVLIVSAFFSLLGGCVAPKNIAVEISHPPPIPVPDSVSSLTLVAVVPGGSVKEGTEEKVSCEEPSAPPCRLLAAENALRGVSGRIYDESDYEVKGIIEWLDTVTGNAGMADASLLCSNTDTSGLLVILEQVTLDRQISTSRYQRWPREAKNKVWSKTIIYNVEPVWMHETEMRMTINNHWKVYDCNIKQIIFEGDLTDSVFYKVDGSTKEEVMKKLPSVATSVAKAGFIGGWDFAGEILPSSVTVMRKYYASRLRVLREATRQVKFRQWDKAEEEWIRSLERVSPARKAKILYNLALARERHGDYAKALEYIHDAEKISPSAEVTAYKKILERESEKRKY
jgi:hypothetical protein